MNSYLLLASIVSYFALLLGVSFITGRNSNNSTFFTGNRKAPWYIISFGMLGASLSGVTFISVPGWVLTTGFSYMQMVLGYVVGYIVVSQVLLPVYYKLKLPSIYSYLENRFGKSTYKAGSWFFILSRTIGSSFRLYLMASVLQLTIFNSFGVPFYVTVIVTIALIWLYTFRSGMKTIIWTDALQTLMLLAALIITGVEIAKALNLSTIQVVDTIRNHPMSKVFVFDDWSDKQHFVKQFLSGMFMTIVMTGLDQDMMQKNLSCRNLRDAQKNMRWYGLAFVPVNLLFLSLGLLLVVYSSSMGIDLPAKSDDLFPALATGGYFHPWLSVVFLLGLTAAAYSSADSALTALTTSFAVDILGIADDTDNNRSKRVKIHIAFSVLLAVIILLFNQLNNQAVISAIFTVAGYTYGPLLGIYAVGLFTRWQPDDKKIPFIMILAPVLSLATYYAAADLGWVIGFEILLINGFYTIIGLALIRK